MVSKSKISKLVSYINKMPALPATVSKVLAICGELNTSAADLSRVISLDPVLTGKILKLINSAYYGLRQEVVSMTRAIIMLGMNTVKNLALATAILGKVGKLKTRGPLNMDDSGSILFVWGWPRNLLPRDAKRAFRIWRNISSQAFCTTSAKFC